MPCLSAIARSLESRYARRRRRWSALALACLCLSGGARDANARRPHADAVVDDEAAAFIVPPPQRTGPVIAPRRGRPSQGSASSVACSFTEAVCVHPRAAVSPEAQLTALASAERALFAYRALGLPAPLPDERLGGSPALDVYLDPDADAPFVTRDLVARRSAFDEASVFAVLAPPPRDAGCLFDFMMGQIISEAILARLDAGAAEGEVSMTSTYLASLVAPCGVAELEAVDDVQRAPERAITSGHPGRPDGQFLFPAYLDAAHGAGASGGVIAALFAVATQATKPGSWRFDNEPDLFDALRAVTKDRRTSSGALLLDYAVSRAFMGTRSDGAHQQDVARFGELGRVRFEWSVPYASLPRRLAPLRPIEPTGATYLWLDLEGASKDAELTFVADWELPVLFRWALLKIARDGSVRGRFDVAGIFGSHHAEKRLMNLGEDLAGLLVVGVNEGGLDRANPFDPDEAPLEPHAYTVTFYP